MEANRKEYFIEARNPKIEPIVRQFLFERVNIVSLTNSAYRDNKNPSLQKVLESLKGDFIREEIDNKKYFIEQSKRPLFHHYFYKLSDKLKEILNKETLFWSIYPQTDRYFYILENPAFFKDEILLGHVTTHENYFHLYLTDEEKSLLEKLGLDFTIQPPTETKLAWYWKIPVTVLLFVLGFVFLIFLGMYKIWDNVAYYFGKLTGKYK